MSSTPSSANPRAAHINNLYNTSYWCLIAQDGLSPADAHKKLSVRE
jgi:tRNA(His) 5'-end guanylyltransferase